MKKQNSFGDDLKKKIRELEISFVELYKQAINFKINQQEKHFFDADQKLQLITEEICDLSGEDELSLKERLTKEASQN